MIEVFFETIKIIGIIIAVIALLCLYIWLLHHFLEKLCCKKIGKLKRSLLCIILLFASIFLFVFFRSNTIASILLPALVGVCFFFSFFIGFLEEFDVDPKSLPDIQFFWHRQTEIMEDTLEEIRLLKRSNNSEGV